MDFPIIFDEDRLSAVCRRYGIRVMEAFGSVLREDFDPQRSDLDVLVLYHHAHELQNDDQPLKGLAAITGLRDELAQVFGRRVDVVNAATIENPFFFAEAMKNRRRLYAAA